MLKHVTKYLLTVFIIALAVTSCTESPDEVGPKGKMSFSFSFGKASNGRIAQDASAVLVTLQNESGNVVLHRQEVELYSFAGEYLSAPIALPPGNYKVTEFFVIDANDAVLYATPVQGSPLAYLVNNPLPVDFSVIQDQTSKVVLEVLEVGEHGAIEFGYATFSFDVVGTINFAIGVFTYNPDTKNLELTTAQLDVKSHDGKSLYAGALENKTSLIALRDDAASYKITVAKNGYKTYEKVLTPGEISQYNGAKVFIVVLLESSLDEGLLAYYPFNGDAEDETENHFDGIVHGATLCTDRKGNPNSSYCFDGVDDYINVPHHDALNLLSDFTISVWAEVSATQDPNNAIADIMRKWSGNSEGYPFAIAYLTDQSTVPDRIILVRYDGQACGNGPTTYSNHVDNGQFMHIVYMKEGSTLRHYANGVLISELTDETSCGVGNTTDMTIGCRGNLLRFFNGKIDDIRIYTRALSGTEVSALYAE